MIATLAAAGLAIFPPGPTMQITHDPGTSQNAISAYETGLVRMQDRVYRSSLFATRETVVENWDPPPVDRLAIDDFAALLALAPQVVILGTGPSQRLPRPELFAAFAARGVGLEVMDTGAACRTYNLLLSEYREVAIALML